MARVNIFGKSGSGKSWFGGWVLENVLTNEGESVLTCGCEDDGCSHERGDDEWVPDVDAGEEDGDTPEVGGGTFKRAIHIDIEDEEPNFSDPDAPILLTYHADKENIRQYVTFDGDPPSYIPERELEDGDEILLPKWVFYKNRYIRVVPEGLTDQELIVLVEMLADAAMKAGDTHFSLDEAHLVAKKHDIGDKLMRLATGGRKRGVEWLFVTQRPQKMHEDLLSQSDFTVYFALTDRDRDKAAEKAEAIPNAEDKIESLGERQAIIEDFSNGTWHRFSTNNLERVIEHASGDDGKANDTYESLFDTPGDGGEVQRDDGDGEEE